MKEIKDSELKKLQIEILKAVDAFCIKNNLKYSLAFGTLLGAVRHGGYIPWDDDIDIMMPRHDYELFLASFSHDRYKVFSYSTNHKFVLPYAKVIDNQTVLYEHSSMKLSIGVNIDVFPIDICPDLKEEYRWFREKEFWNNIYTIRKLRLCRERKFYKNIVIVAIRLITFPLSLGWLCNRLQKMALQNERTMNDRMAVLATADTKLSWMMPKKIFSNYKKIEFENYQFQAIEDTDYYLKSTYGDYMTLPPLDQRITHHGFDAFWK